MCLFRLVILGWSRSNDMACHCGWCFASFMPRLCDQWALAGRLESSAACKSAYIIYVCTWPSSRPSHWFSFQLWNDSALLEDSGYVMPSPCQRKWTSQNRLIGHVVKGIRLAHLYIYIQMFAFTYIYVFCSYIYIFIYIHSSAESMWSVFPFFSWRNPSLRTAM